MVYIGKNINNIIYNSGDVEGGGNGGDQISGMKRMHWNVDIHGSVVQHSRCETLGANHVEIAHEVRR